MTAENTTQSQKVKGTGGSEMAPLRKQATPEQLAKFNMDGELVRFMFEEPFYSHILRHVSKIETKQIPTAGVIADKEKLHFKLFYNKSFCAALPSQKMQGLLIHECLHLVFEHTTKRRLEPHQIANWAADLAINSIIPEEKLPEGGLIPGKAFDPLTPQQQKSMTPEMLQRYEYMSNLIASFPTHKSQEWYFNELINDPEAKNYIEQQQQRAKSLQQALKDGDIKVDENGNLVDKDGNPVVIMPGPTDDHEGWGEGAGGEELSDEDQSILDQRVKDALSKAIKEADRSNSWGSVSHETRGMLRKLVSREVPWQQVLKRFIGFAKSQNRKTSWSRINRRVPGGTTGSMRGYEARIAIYVDMSGSVSNDDLGLLMGELEELSKRAEFTLYPFDTEIGKPQKYKRRRFNGLERTKYGGTNFDAVCKHMNDLFRKRQIDGGLILTDGECYKPVSARGRRGWVIVPGRKLYFEEDMDKSDILINMDRPEDNKL